MEPFDDFMRELLKKAGIRTHLVSDQSHYWEEGGATYHTCHSDWKAVRGRKVISGKQTCVQTFPRTL